MKFSPLFWVAAALVQILTPAGAATDGGAELILRNGAIYQVQPEGKWSEAIAIRDGKIVALGSNQDIDRLQRAGTKVIDLKGRMAMPGIIDNHVHVGEAASQLVLYNCEFSPYADFEEVIANVRKCAADKRPDEWIIGQHWGSRLYERLSTADAIKQLDAASGGRPVVLRNDTIHDHWVNSRALGLAGITRDTPDPEGGQIGHDPKTGELNGLMLESAKALIESKVPRMSAKLSADDLAVGVKFLNSQGVTGFNDAAVLDGSGMLISSTDLFHQLDQQGRLTAHAGLSMLVAGFSLKTDASEAGIDKIYANRAAFRSSRLSMDFAKIFVDGVMVSHTAVFLAPYLPDAQHGNSFRGEPKMSQAELNRMVTSLDKRGISVKLHVAGDGSVRMALDAIAAARKANGNQGPIHTLAHGGYIAASDIPRVRSLGVAIDASPTVWYPGPILTGTEAVIGKERADHYWPFKTFDKQGVLVAGGTDWKTLPGEFSDLWDGMEGMVTRRNPTGQAPGTLWPEEAVDVATMIRFYTINGAKALRIADRAGSLEVGKSADIVVLDQNLFRIPADQIAATKVDMTLFEGKVVHER